jgi:hypothetical protein
MATFAVIDKGIVENCIVADSLELAEEISGKTCVEYEDANMVSPGFTYAGGIFTNPNPPEEEVIIPFVPLEEEGFVPFVPSEE